MGQGQLLAAAAALMVGAVFSANAAAQGPVYRERWAWLHLERRRAELREEIAARAPADREQVARILAEPTVGSPFLPVAKALAVARGTTADESFVLRAAVSVYVLPEVADPDAAKEVCRGTNLSVFLPFSPPAPGELAFDVEVHDEKGAKVWATKIERNTTVADLRQAQAVAVVPAVELADGTYRVHVRTLIDGQGPRAADPALSWRFHVLRGYQARSEGAVRDARAVVETLEQPQRALLSGLEAPVLRAYYGEAFEVESNAVVELQRLELAVRNVAQRKPVLAGMSGRVLTALPSVGTVPLSCVLCLPASVEPRPLVVLASGAPAYDLMAYRPTAPATRGPVWTAHELAQFAAQRDWNIAFLDSPGGARNFMADVCSGITTLRALLHSEDQPVVLVCDREAATVASFHVDRLRELVSGLVLVGGGALQGKTLDGLGALAVRLAPLHGYPGTEGLQRTLDEAARRRAEQAWSGNVERLATHEPPWTMGLPLLAEDIERFAAHVFTRPH
ncbi:MAG TPA: hypothetical protein VFT55_03220 [Planctomycetota bacterium]|nr:hypothetical protein [Planctomycetota bacterium]